MSNRISSGGYSSGCGLVEWVDKETLRYSENAYSVLVWVDFVPGLFTPGRIIRAGSIRRWEVKPADGVEMINEQVRTKIISEMEEYYRSRKVKCAVEP